MTPENDQWKLNGDCDKCRRAEFCRKSCTARKKVNTKLMQGVTEAIVDNRIPEPFASNMKKFL